MAEYPPLYPHSVADAKRLKELGDWRESHRANIACKEAIEEAIRTGFDGMHLDGNCAKGVIQAFGYKRVRFVLANTLKQKSYDGRFSAKNREWFSNTYVPPDPNHNSDFEVDSHPAVLDSFMRQYREAYQALGLFGPEQCEADWREHPLAGKVLAVSPSALGDQYLSLRNQLWYANGGFGCSPEGSGRAVFATCLADGEEARWNRADFIGPVKEELLPEWAKSQVEQLRAGQKIGPITTPAETHVPDMTQSM